MTYADQRTVSGVEHSEGSDETTSAEDDASFVPNDMCQVADEDA